MTNQIKFQCTTAEGDRYFYYLKELLNFVI